jgi:hypothetical protein
MSQDQIPPDQNRRGIVSFATASYQPELDQSGDVGNFNSSMPHILQQLMPMFMNSGIMQNPEVAGIQQQLNNDEVDNEIDQGHSMHYHVSSNTSDSSSSNGSDSDDNFIPLNISSTMNMPGDQILEHICKFVNNIFEKNPPAEHSSFGANVVYRQTRTDKTIGIRNIILQVNQVTLKSIDITQHISDANGSVSNKYLVRLNYVANPSQYFNGQSYSIGCVRDTLKDAIQSSYDNLKRLHLCNSCKSIYDSTFTDHCVVCMFSNFYTHENQLITCAVCTDKFRDHITLNCGHRFCWDCARKNVNRKCPICRAPYQL